MSNGLTALVLTLTVAYVKGHLAWNSPDLHPVQGLYVKPSSDGTTGDLYVAASEDSGVHSQWLTDQPINFLPSQHQRSIPQLGNALSSNALPHDESIINTQKRAVIADGAAKYAYALPSATPGAGYTPYAYAGIQSAKTEPLPSNEASPVGAVPAPAAVPQYSPYYMYPHLMHAAYANAFKVLKDAAGAGSEDASNSNAISPYPTAYWPTSYYPMQYVMMDPAAWAKSHAAAQPASTTSAPTSEPTTESSEES